MSGLMYISVFTAACPGIPGVARHIREKSVQNTCNNASTNASANTNRRLTPKSALSFCLRFV